MKHYYGLVDPENNGWGFVEEGDSRITDDMIRLTETAWESLIEAQSDGKEIVCYDGKVFNAEPGYYYIDDEGEWQKRSDEEVETARAEAESLRINNLTMTALDFIGVLQSFGLSLEQINAYLESNLEVKMQLTYCQNVYCGVVKALMPITLDDITITADMIEAAFRVKNGETVE